MRGRRSRWRWPGRCWRWCRRGARGAVDPTCVFTTGDVRTFTARTAAAGRTRPTGTPAGIPNDNTGGNATRRPTRPTSASRPGSRSTSTRPSCSTSRRAGSTSRATGSARAIRRSGRPGVALFNNDPSAQSVTEEGASLDATSAYLGGQGTLQARGDLSVAASPRTGRPASRPNAPRPGAASHAGQARRRARTGRLLLPNLGVNLSAGLRHRRPGPDADDRHRFPGADSTPR